MLTVVGTVALDTLALVKALARTEETGGIVRLHADLPGGTGGNVAMALARLGAPPRLVSATGGDFAGSAYERALREAGVDLARVVRSSAATSRAYVFFDADNRQVTYFHAGASADLASLPGGLEGRVHFAAGEIACYPRLMRSADWVSFDPGQEVFHRDLKQVTACLEHVDLLFLNRHERDVLRDAEGLDVPQLLDLGIGTVVETRGREGCVVHTREGARAAPAVPVAAVDPTGAGDAHRAGFLFALERGASLDVAARFASACGSFVVEAVGAQTRQPTLAQAEARYRDAFGAAPW